MAPRKTYTADPTLTRITRSSTHPKTQLLKPESPKKKIAKTQKKPTPKALKKAPAKAEKINNKVKENGDLKAPKAAAEVEENGDLKVNKKTVIIEHCKQCNSFKTRALQVKAGLEEGVEGVNVVVNPEKPRRGCFEIREEGENGEKFVSLLEMKRPFGPMKALDMEQVISDIIQKVEERFGAEVSIELCNAEPIRSVDMKNAGNEVDKKQVRSKRKITSTIDVHPSVLERTTGLELMNTKTAAEQPMVQGWTKEQELALQGAYFSVKPTPHFWKKVAKMVPGKSAQECFEKINSDILTPSQPQRRSVSKKPSSLTFSLSPSILLTPSEPTSKKSWRGKGKQCSYKNVRHLINKQSRFELPKGGADMFSVFEPSSSLSTQPVQNAEVVSKGKRSLSPAHKNDHSGHGDELRGCLNSPPVLKQIKNKALHEKYIDQLHTREAKRKVASKKATRCMRGKIDVKESQVLKEEAIGRAKSSLIVNARSAINQFLQSQSTITGDSDDGNDIFYDDIEDDDPENSL